MCLFTTVTYFFYGRDFLINDHLSSETNKNLACVCKIIRPKANKAKTTAAKAHTSRLGAINPTGKCYIKATSTTSNVTFYTCAFSTSSKT